MTLALPGGAGASRPRLIEGQRLTLPQCWARLLDLRAQRLDVAAMLVQRLLGLGCALGILRRRTLGSALACPHERLLLGGEFGAQDVQPVGITLGLLHRCDHQRPVWPG